MLTPPSSVRVYLATEPVDLRRGHDGLCALVRSRYRRDPYEGSLFAFVGRRQVSFLTGVGKVLAWKLPATDPRVDAAVKLLGPGDVIAYSNARDFSHVVLYDGKQRVFCHTRCRNADKVDDMDSHWKLDMTARYTCIHILD